jgi:hypothetical protein
MVVLQMEWAHPTITKQDKVFMVVFGLLGAAITFYLLVLCPSGLMAFDAQGASVAMVESLKGLMAAKVHKELKVLEIAEAPTSGLLVGSLLVVPAAFICEHC